MPGVDVVLAQLSEDPISVGRATAAVQGDEAGAVASFSGLGPEPRRGHGRQQIKSSGAKGRPRGRVATFWTSWPVDNHWRP
jgi:hypothetical protein